MTNQFSTPKARAYIASGIYESDEDSLKQVIYEIEERGYHPTQFYWAISVAVDNGQTVVIYWPRVMGQSINKSEVFCKPDYEERLELLWLAGKHRNNGVWKAEDCVHMEREYIGQSIEDEDGAANPSSTYDQIYGYSDSTDEAILARLKAEESDILFSGNYWGQKLIGELVAASAAGTEIV